MPKRKGPEVILTCVGCEFYERENAENHFCTSLKSGERRKLYVANWIVRPDERCPYQPKIQERGGVRIRGFAKNHK